MRLLDKRKFRRWLMAKPATAIVGVHRDCHDCPLNRFSVEVQGIEIVISNNDGPYVLDAGGGKRPMAEWAAAFAWEADRTDEPLTAMRALQILDGLSQGDWR